MLNSLTRVIDQKVFVISLSVITFTSIIIFPCSLSVAKLTRNLGEERKCRVFYNQVKESFRSIFLC